jgi:hypothetical protein
MKPPRHNSVLIVLCVCVGCVRVCGCVCVCVSVSVLLFFEKMEMPSSSSSSRMLRRRSLRMTRLLLLSLCCLGFISELLAVRQFRSWSVRTPCENAQQPNYPYAYSKYGGEGIESKGRVNSNLQDFRHECQAKGGLSKCHICEDIACSGGTCHLQLQGVSTKNMSKNIPTVSDDAWAVTAATTGVHRHDFGNSAVTHVCVFISRGSCVSHGTQNFDNCTTRCFGYNFGGPPVYKQVSDRSVTDFYIPPRWEDDERVDYWAYPRNCSEYKKYFKGTKNCTYSNTIYGSTMTPSFNPQGFAFTVAGSGRTGFQDGQGTSATFKNPQDVAVDDYDNIFVSDTENNAIRMINTAGYVSTIAGKGNGVIGYKDGACSVATFSEPTGIDVMTDTSNANIVNIVVADTGNHRIRKIVYNLVTHACTVACLSGLCGNSTLSETLLQSGKSSPNSGYADGEGLFARFSAPRGIAYLPSGNIVVADSGNYLIRWLSPNGTTSTLAGTIIPGEKNPQGNPLAGCPPPCLQGQQGLRDGNLTYAQFFNPLDVTRGPNNTVYVVDEHRVRVIELPNVVTKLYNIYSEARVSTIAGTSLQGREDGINTEANFFDSYGIFVTADNIAHVVDSASCRVRRVTPIQDVAQMLTCSSDLFDVFRPSGCTSYDPNLDKIGRKVSRVEANVQYNYGFPYNGDYDRGMYIKNCVGSAPPDRLDKHFLSTQGDNLVIDDHRVLVNEFGEQGMVITLKCPSQCKGYDIYGQSWYSEYSSICAAAIHAGIITNARGGLIEIEVQRTAYMWDLSLNETQGVPASYGYTNFTITSEPYPSSTSRIFNIRKFFTPMSMVHTVAGAASAPLESGCGFQDAQPANQALFNKPRGIAAKYGTSLSQTNYIFVADSGNNRIRAISAVCTQICENGGTCIGPDKCSCPSGWSGVDCTIPTCGGCNDNSVCTSPNVCTCKPGYGGTNCKTPLCSQSCKNGGVCTAPDTCTCKAGWFDSNCTTPVCEQTCANGGNCTGVNTCSCPKQWKGYDCRIPVCKQNCTNSGYCMAPDTCACPPQWINYDCSVPVCHQGFFLANKNEPVSSAKRFMHSSYTIAVPTYKNCDMQTWCNNTNEFECDQTDMSYGIIGVPWGAEFRNITGRKVAPSQCMNIELPIDYKIPFELIYSDGTTTGYKRYSPNSPYTSYDKNAWRGYTIPTENHTGPWSYEPDRQVANVNWLNVSQGVYVCANEGNCVAPDVCQCAPGWAGFDCRTPVCGDGYWHINQTNFVSGLEIEEELDYFTPFLKSPTLLTWPYSNPSFVTEWERYDNQSVVKRYPRHLGGVPYLGASELVQGKLVYDKQGGYRCSVRAWTQYEHGAPSAYVLDHPNYYSRYMDNKTEHDGKIYSNWTNMYWPPVSQKSRILDVIHGNITYIFTNEGYRRAGVWNRTGNNWEYGTCLMEFERTCADRSKRLDLSSGEYDVLVMDTDYSYRMKLKYDDDRVSGPGRWNEAGGPCVDHVVRGCKNNGTCVAPHTCKCAAGWSGVNCTTPICDQPCFHNGNCTGPNQCTCEKGWKGNNCSTPICAQECLNAGRCVAPDTCHCNQWANDFRDGRVEGGRPLYRDTVGNPLYTGWTGFDCSVPICVQAPKFYNNIPIELLPFPYLNVPDTWVGVEQSNAGTTPTDIIPPNHTSFYSLGGHGADAELECTDDNDKELPRCPSYDLLVTANTGVSFQGGCGYDPYDTACCDIDGDSLDCYACEAGMKVYDAEKNEYYCNGELTKLSGTTAQTSTFKDWLDVLGGTDFRQCGSYHSPRYHEIDAASGSKQDYGTAKYYKNPSPYYAEAKWSSQNKKATFVSNRFLCRVRQWVQGDYLDNAGIPTSVQGIDSIYGMESGRHVRINYPNLAQNVDQSWSKKGIVRGEGVYGCYNYGSCLGPDSCTCTDGYTGYDCSTPMCRHLQVSGTVSSCMNGGICVVKDTCVCINASSVLYIGHPGATRGVTGWTGSDCSIPMCVQGYFDPFCTDLEQAVAGEGCYRCANGGNCTAPDVCTCAPGWTGYDCKTPVCEAVADPLTRTQLGVVYEAKVIAFESDPCGLVGIYGMHGFHGTKYARGNCSQPNLCTCMCKVPYSMKACKKHGHLCEGAWQDPMYKLRDVLSIRGAEYEFGSTACAYGYEGNVDELDRFTTCHQTIYLPSSIEKDSVILICVFSICGFFGAVAYYFVNERVKQRYLLAKIERRRSKRSSEESLTKAGAGAFVNK